jgi:hypothetical protein
MDLTDLMVSMVLMGSMAWTVLLAQPVLLEQLASRDFKDLVERTELTDLMVSMAEM